MEIESTFIILANEEFIKLNKIIEESLLKFSFEMNVLKKYEYIRYYYKKFLKEKYFNNKSKTANEKLEKELKKNRKFINILQGYEVKKKLLIN